MSRTDKDIYDAIIIGAGISGLVCGCYLAKAGMKVLIAEQHHKPGGYCTSFKRKGFTFDAAAHSFGGFKYGNLARIFKDLDIDDKIKLIKMDPSNVVSTPEHEICFWENLNKTIEEFQANFPAERNPLETFFCGLVRPDPLSFIRMRNWSFSRLLDQYFRDKKLKAILSFPLFGNAGVPPSQISAFLGFRIYKEFILDGGYQAEGGMQILSDAFAKTFQVNGGELRLSSLVKKIRVKDNIVTGVVLEKDGFIPSRNVVSNCDARRTFYVLLGKRMIPQTFISKMDNMVPSPSMFILYLGIDKTFKKGTHAGSNFWKLSQYDLDYTYSTINTGRLQSMLENYLMHIAHDGKSVRALLFAPFRTKAYWHNNKDRLIQAFINRIESDALPDLSRSIIYKDAATPQTLHRYTLNYKGSAFGWAGMNSQLVISDFTKPGFVHGLYLTGHWTTHGLGIPGVAYVGYETAKYLLKKRNGSVQNCVRM